MYFTKEIKRDDILCESYFNKSFDPSSKLNWVNIEEHQRIEHIKTYVYNEDSSIKENLDSIVKFLIDNLVCLPKEEQEIEEELLGIPKEFRSIIKIRDYKFTIESKLLIFDVLMLISYFLEKEISGLKWVVEKNKNLHDYGFLKLKNTTNNKEVSINYALLNLCHRMIGSKVDLFKYYLNWKNELQGNTKDYLSMIESWTNK